MQAKYGDPSSSSRRQFKQATQMHLCLNLLPEDVLESLGVSSELADTLAELVDGHCDLVEVETEETLVVEVALLLNVELGHIGCVELLWEALLAVVELLKETRLRVLSAWKRSKDCGFDLRRW